MSAIQNFSKLGKQAIEPAAFAALALLASKTRLIEYFPATTDKAFALTAALTGTASLLYDNTLNKDRDSFKPLIPKAIGIDRLTMLFTDALSIRDVLYFPMMRPEE